MWTTTLNKILSRGPCEGGWYELLRSLNKTCADDEPIPLAYILRSNGIEDAIWALRTVDGRDKEIRLFAVRCARQVQHLMSDPRSIQGLDVAEMFATGQTTNRERAKARSSSLAAIQDAIGTEALHASSAAFYTLGVSPASAARRVFEVADQAMLHAENISGRKCLCVSRASFRSKQINDFIIMVGGNSE